MKDDPKKADLLNETFKLMRLLFEISTFHPKLTLNSIRKILKNIYNSSHILPFLSDFYLMNLTLDNGGKF